MKIQESEDALVSLFKNTQDESIRSDLIFALCDLASPYAIKLGVPLLPDKYDTTFDSLEKNLYIVASLNDIDHPQLEEWERIAKEDVENYKRISIEIERL